MRLHQRFPAERPGPRRAGTRRGEKGLHCWRRLKNGSNQVEIRSDGFPRGRRAQTGVRRVVQPFGK